MLPRKFELIPIKFGFPYFDKSFLIHVHVPMLRGKFELILVKFKF